MADAQEVETGTRFDYDSFLKELDSMGAEEALYAMMAHSGDVVNAWQAMIDPREDGAANMGRLFAGMMHRVELAHSRVERTSISPLAVPILVPEIDMNWSGVAEHYLFTIESVQGGSLPTDWAMEFAVVALSTNRPKEVSLAVGRARQFFATSTSAA